MEDLRSGLKRKRIRTLPGSEWTDRELDFFKIKIKQENTFENFFGKKPLLVSDFPPHIQDILSTDLSHVSAMKNVNWGSITNRQLSRFIKHIFAVTKTHTNEESAVDDFARTLLECFDYDSGDLAIRSREELTLEMCGSRTSAKPDLCVETSTLTIKLLVQEDKSYRVSMDKTLSNTHPEAQVIAEAIAAFQENNKIRKRLHLCPENSQLIPCITMLGTYPTFYLFKVTKELAEAVRDGEEPEENSIVLRYAIPIEGLLLGDALLDNDIKLSAFQCYMALKNYLK